ncbi:MAG: hypothetical protein AAB213_05410 [Candidatus Omnitrophota bacterium]
MDIKWSKKLAYSVGLLVSDGNLSKDGRHIVFVSKDKDSVENFKFCLNLENRISVKDSGYNRGGRYYHRNIFLILREVYWRVNILK